MTLTSEQVQTITRHLAEKVCSFQLVKRPMRNRKYDFYEVVLKFAEDGGELEIGVLTPYDDHHIFSPLTDPRDTALVMEAWQSDGRFETTEIILHTGCVYTHVGQEPAICCQAYKWTEAVCLAIFRASGGKGI